MIINNGITITGGVSLSSGSYMTVNFQGTFVDSSVTSRTTTTYTSAPIGVASEDRWVLVTVINFDATGAATSTVSNITVDGISVTTLDSVLLQGYANASGACITYGWVKVTSGTTANIVVTYATAITTQTAVGVYSLQASGSFTGTRVNVTTAVPASGTLTTSQTHGNNVALVAVYFRLNSTITATGGTLSIVWGPTDIRSGERGIFALKSNAFAGTDTFSVTSSSADSGGALSQMMFQLT